MRFFAVEVIEPAGTTLMVFCQRWEAEELFHYLANYGHCVHTWEL